MNLRFTRRAIEDLDQIAACLRERNPAAALRVRAAILESLGILAGFPLIGRRQTVEGVRKLAVRHYPYLVYYSVDQGAGEIAIIAILHTARERGHENA